MCNTCHNFDEWESCETHFKVQLLSLSSFNFPCHFLSFSSSIEASSLSFLSKTLSWWWSFSFHGLFPSRWRLLSPLLLYLPPHLHGGESPLKDLIEAQRSSLHRSFSSKLPSLTLCRKPLTLTPIYRSHIHFRLTHPHNTILLYYFLPTLQTQTLCHISFSIISLLHNVSSLFVKWLVRFNGHIIKTNEGDKFQCPHPLFFKTKRGLPLEALKIKIHERLHLQQWIKYAIFHSNTHK